MTLFQLQHHMKWKDGYEYEMLSKKSAVAYLKADLLQCDCCTQCQENGFRNVPISLDAVSFCGVAPNGKPTDQNHKQLMK